MKGSTVKYFPYFISRVPSVIISPLILLFHTHAGPKRHRHRKSMLLSELCVVAVSVPAELTQGQRGRGMVLKFRFSPYTLIELLRVAILKVNNTVNLCTATTSGPQKSGLK